MLNFKYNVPTEILFGKNQITRLPVQIQKYGKKVLLVYGKESIKKSGLYAQVMDLLKEAKLGCVELGQVDPNPRITSVREGVKLCQDNSVDFVLAVGAGSTIDCAKLIAAGVYYDGDPWDFIVGKQAIHKALPVGTVLTLAATGTEMNGNAVITNNETQQKMSASSFLIRPKFSILDPTYTFTVNKWHTAAGVVDIMSHVFEQYFSTVKGTFLQDRMAESILKTCINYGQIAIKEPDNYEARANLMWAGSLALNSMLSCGKRGDWVTHAIEHGISAIYDLTHGAGLAIITPNWMNYVLQNDNNEKFTALAKNIWNIHNIDDQTKLAKAGIVATKTFFKSMDMPTTLKEVSIDNKRIDDIAELAITAHGPTKTIGSFKKLNKEDIIKILENSL